MVKTNYTKVEDALKQGLEDFKIEQLLEMTEIGAEGTLKKLSGMQLLTIIQYELKSLQRHGFNLYLLLNIDKKEFKRFIDHPDTIEDADKEKLILLQQKIEAFRKEKKAELTSDENIVEQERHKHKNKRINVKNDWLPLK